MMRVRKNDPNNITGNSPVIGTIHWTRLPRLSGREGIKNFQAGSRNDTTASLTLTNLNVTFDLDRQQQIEKNQSLIQLLRTWRESDDATEQQETLEYLMQAPDEDRPASRKLFR